MERAKGRLIEGRTKMKEKKTDYIIMKATPSFKAMAFALAEEEGRSLSNYIEWLINNDMKRRERESEEA